MFEIDAFFCLSNFQNPKSFKVSHKIIYSKKEVFQMTQTRGYLHANGKSVDRINQTNWLTINESATYAGMSSNSIRKMIADGTLKAYKPGNRMVKIKKDDIDKAIESQPIDPTEYDL